MVDSLPPQRVLAEPARRSVQWQSCLYLAHQRCLCSRLAMMYFIEIWKKSSYRCKSLHPHQWHLRGRLQPLRTRRLCQARSRVWHLRAARFGPFGMGSNLPLTLLVLAKKVVCSRKQRLAVHIVQMRGDTCVLRISRALSLALRFSILSCRR